jgi:hypothetical protein
MRVLSWAWVALSMCGTPASAPVEGERASTEALDPTCATPHANVRAGGELPSGVERDPRPREAVLEQARTWRMPDEVHVTFEEPRVHARRIELRVTLRNTGPAPATVLLSEAGTGFFHAALLGHDDARRRPAPSEGTPPPALFPEPAAFTLAPGAAWTLETRIVLACWERLPSTVRVHWWLSIENEGREGEVEVTLPAP